MRECYISVDIETTGPTPGTHSMIELGAVLVDDPTKTFFAPIRTLARARVDDSAISAIGLTRKSLSERYTKKNGAWEYPSRAMSDLANWVKKVSPENGRPIFVANNAPFDWMFVAWYFEHLQIKNPFGHSALDMKAFFMGLTKCEWADATLLHMAKFAGVEFNGLPHHALKDALVQARIFSGLLAKKYSD